MKAIDALKSAASSSDVPITHIGIKLGKKPNYISNVASRGSSPQCDTMAAMAAVCGYKLALIPADDVPATALIIDAPE